MKIMNKNIKIPHLNNSLKLLGAFCVLFLTTALYGSNIFKAELQTNFSPDSALIHSNKFQDSKANAQADFLFAFEIAEETEPTDENSDDDTSESQVLPYFSVSLFSIHLKNSFKNFDFFFQKRIQIPLFLLYKSWKIPTI